MQAIEDGDRHAGVLFEEMNGKFDALMETYDLLDNKIDRVDAKLEAFKQEVNFKFDLVFQELRAMRLEMRLMHEAEEAANHCRKLVVKRGGRWALGNEGLRELELLTY